MNFPKFCHQKDGAAFRNLQELKMIPVIIGTKSQK